MGHVVGQIIVCCGDCVENGIGGIQQDDGDQEKDAYDERV